MEKFTVFWFRRDLRLEDNRGLYEALKGKNKVIPIFIYDSEIIDKLQETGFSFDGIKNITCGEGGAVVSKDNDVINIVKEMRLLSVENDTENRLRGQRSWDFDVKRIGYRYHMSNINAAIGRVQLNRFNNDFKQKRIKLHNAGKGAKFTRGRTWKLIYKEILKSKSKAISREYYIKNNRSLRKKIKETS